MKNRNWILQRATGTIRPGKPRFCKAYPAAERAGAAERGGEIGLGLICDETVCAQLCSASETLLDRLRDMLLRWADRECVALRVERASGFSLPENGAAHLLILDMDSVELPEHGLLEGKSVGLIVISRDAGRAIHSYRWHPAAFLKPDFDMRRLSDALSACEKNWRRGRVCLESPYRRRAFRLPLGHIRLVEASAHYCLFYQGKKSVRFRFSIDELETLLPRPPFVRCHRSYLVHLDAVDGMSYTTVKLRDGASLPLGRKYVDSLRTALQAWREGEKRNVDLDHDL